MNGEKRILGGKLRILEFEVDDSEHSDSVLLLVALLLKEHEVDEEHGADQRRLHPHVEIHWEAVRGVRACKDCH